MSNEPEETTPPPAENEEEEHVNLIDITYSRLGLPATIGREMASRAMQLEILLALKQAGVLTAEQINGMLERAAENVLVASREIKNSARVKNKQYYSDLQKLNDAANVYLNMLRERLTSAPVETEPQS